MRSLGRPQDLTKQIRRRFSSTFHPPNPAITGDPDHVGLGPFHLIDPSIAYNIPKCCGSCGIDGEGKESFVTRDGRGSIMRIMSMTRSEYMRGARWKCGKCEKKKKELVE